MCEGGLEIAHELARRFAAVLLASLWVGALALAAGDPPFKLRADGQIDFTTSVVGFAGQATHIGQFTAAGTLHQDLVIRGTIVRSNGDSMLFIVALQSAPPSSTGALMKFLGLDGPLFNEVGEGTGTISVAPDGAFTLAIEGALRECVPPECF
jgi:hypothetical protein